MWCPRTKSTACCHSLFFPVLCCSVNFNWDNTLRVLVYSSEGVWIQVPVRSNEWKHQPVWQQTVYDSDSCSSLRTCFSNTLKSGFFFLFLFIHNGPRPSVILPSHQITSPFTARGAGWLVAGLNERNDQALCGSRSLFYPKKQLPPIRGKIDIVPAK